MKATVQDRELFFRLWSSLLEYANREAGVVEGGGPDLMKSRTLTAHLCRHPELVDGFLEENASMIPAHRTIVEGWKRWYSGKYFLVRFLSGSAIALLEDEQLCRVVFLNGDCRHMFQGQPLPVLLEGALLPFRGLIVAEPSYAATPCQVDGAVRQELEELYQTAKKRGEIRTSL